MHYFACHFLVTSHLAKNDYDQFLPILQDRQFMQSMGVSYFRTALDGVDSVLASGAKTIGATPAVFKLFVSLLVREREDENASQWM